MRQRGQKETRSSAMLCVSGNPLCVEFTPEKLHFCFDLIKAKYWAIVRHLAGYAWHCNYLLRCFCLKGCIHAWNQFQRWLVKGSTFFFFLFPEKKKTLFAYHTSKPPITCHTGCHVGTLNAARQEAVDSSSTLLCCRGRKNKLPLVNVFMLFFMKRICDTKVVLIQGEKWSRGLTGLYPPVTRWIKHWHDGIQICDKV